jgi:membrane protease YdiL (CAAX protease family)
MPPDAARRPARAGLIVFVATLLLFLGLRALPMLLPGERSLGERWNWSGDLLALAGVLWVASILARRGAMPWREMGFTWAQRSESVRSALWVSAAGLLLNTWVSSLGRFRLAPVPLETWLYQATMPGLVEEAVFRGVLLAVLDRVFSARAILFGAPIGWGGVIVTLTFVALHGVSAGALVGVLPAALLYLWLRARTGSLLLPIMVHNLWNLSVYAARL